MCFTELLTLVAEKKNIVVMASEMHFYQKGEVDRLVVCTPSVKQTYHPSQNCTCALKDTYKYTSVYTKLVMPKTCLLSSTSYCSFLIY